MRIQKFEDLECWKEARNLINLVYDSQADRISQINSGLIKYLSKRKNGTNGANRVNAQLSKRATGFTLIEILIAIVILNIGIALFFNAFTMAMKGILGAQRRVVAVNYAQEVMEKYVLPKEFNNLSVAITYVNNATSDNFKLQYQVNYANASNLDQVVSGSTDYKRIVATVTDNLGIVPAVDVIMLKTDYEALE